MNCQTQIGRIAAHFDGQRTFGNQVSSMHSDYGSADQMLGVFIKQQLGKAFAASQAQGPATGRPGKYSLAIGKAVFPWAATRIAVTTAIRRTSFIKKSIPYKRTPPPRIWGGGVRYCL